jgi:serine/threonine protein phosphatase PrpC
MAPLLTHLFATLAACTALLSINALPFPPSQPAYCESPFSPKTASKTASSSSSSPKPLPTLKSVKKDDGKRRTFKPSVKAIKGIRPYMEDENFIGPGSRFVGVFDGHGGAKVSKYIKDNLYVQYVAAVASCPNPDFPSKVDIKEAITAAFGKVDDEVQATRHWMLQGSCAVAVIIHTDEVSGVDTIISANIGDSRAILSRAKRAIDLTSDHKPNVLAEKKRIEKLGGKVKWDGSTDEKGRPIEGSGVYRINGNLATSRAIGDRTERPFVSAVPEVREVNMEINDEFIILASDGVWDVMTSQETVSFVNNLMSQAIGSLSEERAGNNSNNRRSSRSPIDVKISDWAMHNKDDRGIIRDAIMRRKRKMGEYICAEAMRRGSSDNICVVCLWPNE